MPHSIGSKRVFQTSHSKADEPRVGTATLERISANSVTIVTCSKTRSIFAGVLDEPAFKAHRRSRPVVSDSFFAASSVLAERRVRLIAGQFTGVSPLAATR